MPDVVLDWYLFQLNVLLKPDFNCFNSFTLSWVDEVTTGTLSFVSVTINVGSCSAAVPATKHQFLYQVNIRLISELCNGISSVLQKSLKYFNGTINSIYFFETFSGLFCHFFFKFKWNTIIVISSKINNIVIIT